jgi:hypothetical protein
MSDVEVTEVSEVEDSGEMFSALEHHGIHDRVHRYSYLPDPYPILSHFGVLYLSVPRAASLIADHLATDFPDSQREEKKVERRSALTAQAANIYVFYGDLLKWLALIGYNKRLMFESKVSKITRI